MAHTFGFLSRLFSRPAQPRERRSFEGAAGGRRWSGAGTMPAANSSVLAARGTTKNRARYQVSNHPIAASGFETIVAGLIGTGFVPQPQYPNAAIATALGLSWYNWTPNVGEGSLLATMELLTRCVIRDGEGLARLELRGPIDRLELRVDILDPEQLDPSITRDLGNGARIVAGVEFDAAGDRVAYHIRPGSPDLPFAAIQPAVRIPAEEILHVFARQLPGQVRGISALAPVLLKLNEIDATSDALQMRLKVEALIAGFIRDQDGSGGGLATGPGPVAQVEFEPGSLISLPPGTDISFITPTAGGSDVSQFMKSQQREVAAGLGILYEQLTGDLSATNYSSARFGLLEYRRRVRLKQQTILIDQFLGPLWRRFVAVQAHNGLVAAEHARDPELLASVRWIFPGFEQQDPEKEIRADALAVANGFKSRAEVIHSRGLDIDEIDAELAADSFVPAAPAKETQA